MFVLVSIASGAHDTAGVSLRLGSRGKAELPVVAALFLVCECTNSVSWTPRQAPSPRNTGMDSSKLAMERGKSCCGIEDALQRYAGAELLALLQSKSSAEATS